MLMYFECICIYLLHLSLTVLYKLSETTHTHTLTHTRGHHEKIHGREIFGSKNWETDEKSIYRRRDA